MRPPRNDYRNLIGRYGDLILYSFTEPQPMQTDDNNSMAIREITTHKQNVYEIAAVCSDFNDTVMLLSHVCGSVVDSLRFNQYFCHDGRLRLIVLRKIAEGLLAVNRPTVPSRPSRYGYSFLE